VWSVGKGNKIRFWEDQWLGNSSLAIMFWDLYYVCKQQDVTIKKVWDGNVLKLTFRRVFNQKMMDQWYQMEQIASSIRLLDVEDSLVWKLDSSGVYSSHSLYAVLNYHGVTPMFIPAVWKLHVPP
jgi:hypothetical protein